MQQEVNDANISTAIANVALELGVAPPPAVADFAPPDDPDRMDRTAELTGAALRQASAATAKAVRDMVADARAVLTEIEKEADALATSIVEVGDEQATRIERATLSLKGTLARIKQERSLIAASEAKLEEMTK